jgi:hypothetical protein
MIRTVKLWLDRWIDESSSLEFAIVSISVLFAGFTLIAFSVYSAVKF